MKHDAAKMDAVFGNVAESVSSVSRWREQATPPPEVKSWDRNPVVLKRKGVVEEYFDVAAMGEALGRRGVTIRSWEEKGFLPKAWYRTKPPRPFKNTGKVIAGRRLYTRQQIEAVIAAAKVSRVYDPADSRIADWPEFTRLVRAAWSALWASSI